MTDQATDPDELARTLLRTLARLWNADPVLVLLADDSGVTSVILDDRFDREAVKDVMAAWSVNGWNGSISR